MSCWRNMAGEGYTGLLCAFICNCLWIYNKNRKVKICVTRIQPLLITCSGTTLVCHSHLLSELLQWPLNGSPCFYIQSILNRAAFRQFLSSVEIKTSQMRKAKAIYSELAPAREVTLLAETSRRQRSGKAFQWKKEGWWPGEAVTGLIRSRASFVIGSGACLAFSGWF